MDSFNPKPSSPWFPPPYSFFDIPNLELEPPLNASKESGDNFAIDLFESSLDNGQPEDDFFATYIDFEKIECKEANGSRVDDDGGGGGGGGRRGKGRGKRKDKGENVKTQPMKRGRRCRQKSDRPPVNDAGKVVVEPRKAMVAEELAQLWTVDPKRAKRIMANRQSAARSKERKAQHMLHLEEKVKTLNSEVSTLTTQIEFIQRETAYLAAERSELELRLKTMQHQIEIHDAETQELQMELIRLQNSIPETDSSNQMNVGNNHTNQGQTNSLSKSLNIPPLELSQQLSMLHNYTYNCTSQPNISAHEQMMQPVDSTPLSELLQFFQIGISPSPEEHKTTNRGQFLGTGDSISTSLITGESSTISY